MKVAAEDVAEAATVAEIEVKKATAKTTRKAKEATEKVETAAKKPVRKAKAAKLNIVVQSAMGGSITAEEIATKVPKDAINAYVKVEENKIYWTTADDAGSVEIW